MDELGADTAEAKASHILKGLGFDKAMQAKKCKDFSGEKKNSWNRHFFVKSLSKHVWVLNLIPTNLEYKMFAK